MQRARGGDRAAFDELVRATYPDAYALAARLLGDEHDARDAVQEAYLRAYQAIRGFRGEAAFSTWLYRIVANCAASQLERRGRIAHHTLDTVTPPEADPALADPRPEHDPEARSLTGADRQRLAGALARLPDRLRVVVVLRDVYELPHDAIAAELGISTAAARVRLHRARRLLREALFAPAGRTADAPAPRTPDAPAAGPDGTAGPDGSRVQFAGDRPARRRVGGVPVRGAGGMVRAL